MSMFRFKKNLVLKLLGIYFLEFYTLGDIVVLWNFQNKKVLKKILK